MKNSRKREKIEEELIARDAMPRQRREKGGRKERGNVNEREWRRQHTLSTNITSLD